MARQKRSMVQGTVGNVTAYIMRGEGFTRSKSSLTAKRVKTDPAFAGLMKHAELLKEASRLASIEYKQLPAAEKGKEKYRQMVGEKMRELKANISLDKDKSQ
jgi:hypothetical protein